MGSEEVVAIAPKLSSLRPTRSVASSAPMHETTPAVFLIARPSIDVEGMRGYLQDVGGESWLERRLGEADGEVKGGETARRVRRTGLLPQLGARA